MPSFSTALRFQLSPERQIRTRKLGERWKHIIPTTQFCRERKIRHYLGSSRWKKSRLIWKLKKKVKKLVIICWWWRMLILVRVCCWCNMALLLPVINSEDVALHWSRGFKGSNSSFGNFILLSELFGIDCVVCLFFLVIGRVVMEENLYRDFYRNRSSWWKLEVYFRGAYISGLFLLIVYVFLWSDHCTSLTCNFFHKFIAIFMNLLFFWAVSCFFQSLPS